MSLYSFKEDIAKLILRLNFGVLMLFHGFSKLFNGIEKIKSLVVNAGLPEILAYGVYFGEIIFPILIIIGLYTKISALFAALTMVFAIFLAHGHELFALGKTGAPVIELALIYMLGYISIALLGAGRFSFDRR